MLNASLPLTPPLSPILDKHVLEFIYAAQTGNIQFIVVALDKNANLVNVPNPNDNNTTPLHYAVLLKNRTLLEILIARGADCNARAKTMSTPLHWAAGLGLNGICWSLVVKGGASLHAQDAIGYTPMHLSAQAGHTLTVLLLCALGGNLSTRDGGQRTVLHWAAIKGHAELTGALCNLTGGEKSLLHVVDEEYGMTALHWAAHHCHVDCCKELIKWGADFNVRDSKNRTPLDLAMAQSGFQKYYELALLDSGLSIQTSSFKSKLWLRIPPNEARFWMGRVFSHFHISYLILCLGYLSIFSFLLSFIALLGVHYVLAKAVTPTVPLMETSFLHTLHWNWYFIGWVILGYYIVPGISVQII